MQIPKLLIQTCLNHITVGYFARHETPPDNLEDYGPQLENIRNYLKEQNQAENFKLALDYLLAHPEIRSNDFVTLTFPFSETQIREIISYVRQYLYPFDEQTKIDDLNSIALVDS